MVSIAPKVIVRKNSKAKAGAINDVINSLAVGTAFESAIAIKKRVTRGSGADERGIPYGTQGGKLVSPRYPERGAQAKQTKGGAVWYPSSALFHASTRPNSYDVSGGMWEGEAVDVASSRQASIAFRGRSEGQGMRLDGRVNKREAGNRANSARRLAARLRGRKTLGAGSKALRTPKAARSVDGLNKSEDPYFDQSGRAVPRKVSNSLKAGSIWQTKGVNVLQPSNDEMRSIVLGAAQSVFASVVAQSSNEVEVLASPDRTALASAIARRVSR